MPQSQRQPCTHSATALQFVSRARDAREALIAAPSHGDRMLPLLHGLKSNGTATRPLDSIHADATQFLVDSESCYVYGGSVVLEVGCELEKALRFLTHGDMMNRFAPSALANIFSCVEDTPSWGEEKRQPPTYFTVPYRFAQDLLLREPTRTSLPTIETYATHPILSSEYQLLGPGYHPLERALVHGPDIQPTPYVMPDPNMSALERVPPHLREALRNFALRSPADVANTVAAVITGVMAPLFARSAKPRPIIVVDGDQPSVGKTFLAQVIGYILDGCDAPIVKFTTNDEELEKKVVAVLRSKPVSALIIDNAKTTGGEQISSPFLECMSSSPVFEGRILGTSSNFSRPNDLTVFITMNNTKLSYDLTTRGMPIRFAYEGDVTQRDFGGFDPLEYVREHRLQVLAEIFGMIDHWVQHGQPQGTKRHRCSHWAAIVGGIMEICGFPEFLDNAAAAAAEFNVLADELAALAETVYKNSSFSELRVVGEVTAEGLGAVGAPAGRWKLAFDRAGVLKEEFAAARNDRSRATLIGNYLRPLVGRRITVDVDDATLSACLCVRNAPGNSKRYYFEFAGGADQAPPGEANTANGDCRQARTTDRNAPSGVDRDNASWPTPPHSTATTPAGNAESW